MNAASRNAYDTEALPRNESENIWSASVKIREIVRNVSLFELGITQVVTIFVSAGYQVETVHFAAIDRRDRLVEGVPNVPRRNIRCLAEWNHLAGGNRSAFGAIRTRESPEVVVEGAILPYDEDDVLAVSEFRQRRRIGPGCRGGIIGNPFFREIIDEKAPGEDAQKEFLNANRLKCRRPQSRSSRCGTHRRMPARGVQGRFGGAGWD